MNRILSKEVSFELAQLLKENKINIWSKYSYTDFNGIIRLEENASEIHPYAPTIGEVLDWIYDKTGNWFSIDSENNKTYYYYVPKEGEINFSKEYPTILEAYEKAIEYSLRNNLKKNIIWKKKN